MSAVWRPDVNPENGVFSEFEVYWEQLFDQVVFESIFQDKSNDSLRYGSFSTDVLMKVLEDFKREVLRETINQMKKLPEPQMVLFREAQELDFKEFYPTERKRILRMRFEEKIGAVKQVKDDIEFLFDNSFNAYLNTYEQLRNELRDIFTGLNLSGGFSNPLETKTSRIINQLEDYGFSDILNKRGISRSSVTQLLKKCEPKEFFPCSMAILVKSGFFDHLMKNHFKTKEKAFEAIGKIFGESKRNAKGNINILANPNSGEVQDKYTSHRWVDKVEESLLG